MPDASWRAARRIPALWLWSALGGLAGLAAVAAVALRLESSAGRADPKNAEQVAIGARFYAQHCASCHGRNLEGQPNWRERLPSGRLPAPPHDATGHTWHHPDHVLFGITKEGIAGFAPPGYQSDMPAFEGKLTDAEIWAVLAFIKNQWSPEIQERQAGIARQGR